MRRGEYDGRELLKNCPGGGESGREAIIGKRSASVAKYAGVLLKGEWEG